MFRLTGPEFLVKIGHNRRIVPDLGFGPFRNGSRKNFPLSHGFMERDRLDVRDVVCDASRTSCLEASVVRRK